MKSVQNIEDKILSGKRISCEEGLSLYNNLSLSELGALAFKRREQHVPGKQVSYLIDRNINYTNVCNSDCSFCGFYRPSSEHPEAYVQSRAEIAERLKEALELGATRVLFQGGHNDDLPFEFYKDLVAWMHENFDLEINAFSPSEIHQMHLVSGLEYREILVQLKEAGMKGLPGGGAEMLDDDVRKRVSPKKIRSKTWLDVMALAHELALTTTATMVIGFGETLEQRFNHLDALRELQDKSLEKGSEGFNAFISWTLQHNENTSMGRSRHRENYGASSSEYLRNVAISRIYLDNIPHHSASWPTLGADVGKTALYFGCDDFGSTMMEENVVSKAGALTQNKWSMSPEELREHIRDAGFVPVQRDTSYNVLHVY